MVVKRAKDLHYMHRLAQRQQHKMLRRTNKLFMFRGREE
jgi:hypothetical protein